jgi:hypothetical protein
VNSSLPRGVVVGANPMQYPNVAQSTRGSARRWSPPFPSFYPCIRHSSSPATHLSSFPHAVAVSTPSPSRRHLNAVKEVCWTSVIGAPPKKLRHAKKRPEGMTNAEWAADVARRTVLNNDRHI